MRVLLLGLLVGVAPACCQSEIEAAEGELERLMAVTVRSVHAASRRAQKSTEAPASVTVVTREEIRRYGHRSLADILRTVPGFYVSYDRFYSYVGVRGFGRSGDFNAKILVLLNGHRINENVYDGAYPETAFPIDADLIERVEVIRGPGSSLYGTNAFFGVVNIITIRGRDLKGGEAALEGGSLATVQARASFGAAIGDDGGVLLSATTAQSAGQRRIDYPELGGSLLEGDGERADSLFVSYSRGRLTVEGLAASRKKYFPGLYLGQRWEDSSNYGADTRGYVDVHHELSLSKGRMLESRVYFDRYQFDGFNPYLDESGDGTIVSREFANGSWWGGELLLHQPLGENHQMTLGTDFRFNLRTRLMTYDADPYLLYADTRPRTANGAAFVQDDIRLARKLRLSAGLRYDRYSTFGGALSPRVGLIYEPASNTAVKLLYGRSFRAPNSYELFYSTPTYQPNPFLRPERIGSTEAVLERYSGKRYRFSISAFDSRISNFINQLADPETGKIGYLNVGGYVSRGVELEAETKGAGGWEARASYGLHRVIDSVNRQWLAGSPLHVGRLNAAYPIRRLKLTAGASVQILSRRLTSNREPESAAGAYLLPSLTISTDRAKRRGMDVALTIVNLADRAFWDPAGDELMVQRIRQNGRLVRAKVTFRF
ncbi:MAG: TonB-dependent receptor [Bryobacteraceae bacterium]|nr:TonB-dependent receptor [Bryobacteraceae bacterium]